MRWISSKVPLILGALSALASSACEAGGVGDPCVPEDEYRVAFQGYAASEVNVESRSFQCETRVCLVANFQGRVSCPYGQRPSPTDPKVPDPSLPQNERCYLPGTSPSNPANQIKVPVQAQREARRPDDAVYCSCRCDGPDKNATYCECPSGFVCKKLIDNLGLGSAQLAGSYCVKDGTQVDDISQIPETQCSIPLSNCGEPQPNGI